MSAPLIIGGGPAGAAAAVTIAAAGRPVTLIERNAAPVDKLCGDFLSGGAVAALRSLGLDPLTVGGRPVFTIRLVHRHSVAEAALPFPAFGLSRRSLDEALLRLAADRGAKILRGRSVRTLDPCAAGFRARLAGADALIAEAVFLATGKHDLRGHARPPRTDGLLGLKMYYALDPEQQAALRGCIELHLFRDGYAGLQLVEQGRGVVCMLVPVARYRRAGAAWPALLDDLAAEVPVLADRLNGASPCLAQPLAIAGTPYGHLHRPIGDPSPALFRLGDQACVVPSLTGDGMAVALQSGRAAAALWLRGGSAQDYHAAFLSRAALPLRFAGLLHALCRHPATQALAVSACRTWPRGLALAAALSRVAPQA